MASSSMASSSMASLSMTTKDVCLLHAMDREIYTVLAILLFRDPVESMKVMALRLWLEKLGFQNVVQKMLSLPLILINELADETVTCLYAINGTFFSYLSQSYELPLLQAFIDIGVSVQYFIENRVVLAKGINDLGKDVCVKVLSDIMMQAIERNAAYKNSLVEFQSQVRPLLPPVRSNDVLLEDRMIFVTFSKGYPMHEGEVVQFFTRNYGDCCVESLRMQEVLPPVEQALYATIVFRSVDIVEAILSGMKKAKFAINGKHVWVRWFVARRTRPAASGPAMMWPYY